MKNVIIVLTLVMTLTGCGVSRIKSNNYHPLGRNVSSSERSAEFYDCYKQASGQQSSNVKGTQVNVYHGDNSNQETDGDMLRMCMGSKGYGLRGSTNGEVVMNVITLPLSVSLCFLGECPRDFW
jgi:hypothetical protein